MADKEINWILKAQSAASGPIGHVSRSLGGLRGVLGRAGGGLQDLGGHVLGFLKNIAAIGTGIALAVAVAVEEVIRRAVGFADAYGTAVNRVQKITGLTTEASSRLVAVFQRFGLQAGDSIRTIGMLEKNVGNLASSTRGATNFERQWGFALRDSSGHVKNADALILQAADYFNNKHIPATQRAALEAKLFGRNWQQLVPVLSLGSKGITAAGDEAAKLGLVLTKSNAGELSEYRLATIALGEAWGGFQLQIGLLVMPLLTKLFAFVGKTSIPALTAAIRGWFAAHQPFITALGAILAAMLATTAATLRFAAVTNALVLEVSVNVANAISGWYNANRQWVDAVSRFVSTVLGTLIDATAKVIGWVAGLIDKIASNRAAMNLLRGAVGLLATAFGIVSSAVALILDWIGGFLDGLTKNRPVVAAFRTLAGGLAGAFRGFAGALGAMTDWLGGIIAWVKRAIDWISGVLANQHGGVAGFQHGGFIKPGQLAVVGEAGPEIIQAGSATSAGVGRRVNVNVGLYSLVPASTRQQLAAAQSFAPELVREMRLQIDAGRSP